MAATKKPSKWQRKPKDSVQSVQTETTEGCVMTAGQTARHDPELFYEAVPPTDDAGAYPIPDDREQEPLDGEQNMSDAQTTFERLASIDCSRHIEKKGKFSYLSWPFAVRMLRENSPDATWQVVRFDGLPYQKTDCGVFVEVAVTVEGVTLSQIHPVLNQANKPIDNPTAFEINTSIQRALVKAIALHGLGLYIYAGEDLPNPETEPSEADQMRLQELRDASLNGTEALKRAWKGLDEATRNRLADELPALKQAAALATAPLLVGVDMITGEVSHA